MGLGAAAAADFKGKSERGATASWGDDDDDEVGEEDDKEGEEDAEEGKRRIGRIGACVSPAFAGAAVEGTGGRLELGEGMEIDWDRYDSRRTKRRDSKEERDGTMARFWKEGMERRAKLRWGDL